jgi:Ca2+ transporting ATPase
VLFFGPAIFGVYSSWEETEWSDEGYIHFTIFFNTFVFLQVFNEINSRKLRSSDLNVFTDFFNNPLFLIIISSTVLLQILIVQFGGEAVNCNALTFAQHFWCLVIGAGGLLSGYVTRKLPMRWFLWVKINEEASGRSSIYTLVHGDESKHEIEVQTALRKTLFLRSN